MRSATGPAQGAVAGLCRAWRRAVRVLARARRESASPGIGPPSVESLLLRTARSIHTAMLDRYARETARSRRVRLIVAAMLVLGGTVFAAAPWGGSGTRAIAVIPIVAGFVAALTAMGPRAFERFARALNRAAPGVWWAATVTAVVLAAVQGLFVVVAVAWGGPDAPELVVTAWTAGLCALFAVNLSSEVTRPLVSTDTARYKPSSARSLVAVAGVVAVMFALTTLLSVDVLLADLDAEIIVALTLAVAGWVAAWAGFELRRIDTVRRELLDVVSQALSAAGAAQREANDESAAALVAALQRLEDHMHDPGQFPLYVRSADRELAFMLAYAWWRLGRHSGTVVAAYEPWPWDRDAFASRFDQIEGPAAVTDLVEQITMFLHELRARLSPRYVSIPRGAGPARRGEV